MCDFIGPAIAARFGVVPVAMVRAVGPGANGKEGLNAWPVLGGERCYARKPVKRSLTVQSRSCASSSYDCGEDIFWLR